MPRGLIPALAGTTRRGRTGRGSRPAHPRAGGDDAWASPSRLPRAWGSSPRWRGRRLPIGGLHGDRGSSPRWRGRRGDECGNDARAGLIPALAGTTRIMAPATSPNSRAHPRAGGDDLGTAGRETAASSSRRAHPRAGGDDPATAGRGLEDAGGLIPALAGTTDGPRWRGRSTREAPRDRLIPALAGTTPKWLQVGRGLGEGLIPALAGTTPVTRAASRAGGLIPALAGTTARAFNLRAVRGEGGSSPRWRGRPGADALADQILGLIPALAGTTCRSADPASSWAPGSSPRWRGRLDLSNRLTGMNGLIPALAGTTPR